MKKEFLSYLNSQLEQNKNLLAMNSISEEDKSMLQAAVDSLTETIAAVDAMEDSTEVLDELKTTVEELQSSLTAVKEKINQDTKKETTPEMENIENTYLTSSNAIHDFAQTIRKSKSVEEFNKNWQAVLAENGITIAEGSEEAYLPAPVKDRIQDAFDRENAWLSKLRWTGSKRFYARYNDATDLDSENVRAKGHKKGDTKAVQTFQLSAKLIEPQMIYKIAQLDNQTIFETDQDLVNYVIDELVNQISAEIRRCVLVGDGRANDSDYKVNKIISIASHTTTDGLVTVSTETANGFLIDDMRAAVDSIKNDNGREILVFMSKADLRTLSRIQSSETSSPVYMAKEQVAEQIGENVTIVTTDMLGADFKAIGFIADAYYMVGQNVTSLGITNWEDYFKNMQNYRGELMIGGDLVDLKSAFVLKANA